MAEPFGIALVGCGTVGGGVARLLLEKSAHLTARCGRDLQLHTVVVRDLRKDRVACLPRQLLTMDFQPALHDSAVQVVVELVGGVDWARRAVLAALEAGKDVVTANKALLALHGQEIFDTARRHNRAVAFEASVAGGIPIIAALGQSLAANRIEGVQGILNGTCNFILSQMTEGGLTYADALTEAQQRGYAEADPTLDVDGTDTAHKLAILAQLAFGVTAPMQAISRRGIVGIDAADIHFAGELGYTIKLLAETFRGQGDDEVALHVSPVLLRRATPLAQVRGAYNAVHVVGDAVGGTFYHGKGAGQMPTASAVVADLLDLAIGRDQRLFQTQRLWREGRVGSRIQPAEAVRTRFYLRLLVLDQPGVLADVARALAQHHISIASVIQHEAPDEVEGTRVQLVIMTHTASTGDFRQAAQALNRLACLAGPCVYYPVGD